MYIRTERRPRHGRKDLVARLVKELKKPPRKTAVPRIGRKVRTPLIIEQQMRFSDRLQVYVVWNSWAGVAEERRAEIIADAYEDALGKDRASRLSVALGVTPEEATELGLV